MRFADSGTATRGASAISRTPAPNTRGRDLSAAVETYLAAAPGRPSADICLRLAQMHEQLGDAEEAARWALAVAATDADFPAWQAAARVFSRCADAAPEPLRTAKLAVLGSYTTSHLVPMLSLATRQLGVALELYECDYAQYRQEIIDEGSGLYSFEPDFVLILVHHGDLTLPEHSASPQQDVEAELERWTSLWQVAGARMRTTVVQTTFALPPEDAMGHLAAQVPGSRYRMTRALNDRLGDEAARSEQPVVLLDCERLSGVVGKERWFDPRYWHLARYAVAPEAVSVLVRHAAALVASALGLSKKCIVLDLDDTLWGGIVGEDGLDGIGLGAGVDGEAYVAFQEYLIELKRRGIILAVCSKNNEEDAKEPFERHPDMRLRLDDIAAFVADWRPKPDQLRSVAQTLSIGLDSIVFVDDNPVECEAIRRFVPEVDVVHLPDDPSYFVRALAGYLPLQTIVFTDEDARRTEQYRARAEIAALETSAALIDDFQQSLGMQALIAPFNDMDMPRIAQLVGKTNQFNLTARRHSEAHLRNLAADPHCVHFSLRLRDCFTDHGLVAVMIALEDGNTLGIETWLMSCRVIGRTVEAAILNHLCLEAQARGLPRIRGTHVRTARNLLVTDVFERFDFEADETSEGTSTWVYDLARHGPIANEFIDTDSWPAPS